MKDLAGLQEVNVGIVGHGLVGRKLAEILGEREFPAGDTLRIFASERSAGSTVTVLGREVEVELASEADYSGLDIVFNTAPAGFAREHAERIAQQAGAFLDSSSDLRQRDDVPLLIPEINPHVIGETKGRIIAKPNCTTTIGALAIYALHEHVGLRSLTVSSYQSTSGQGWPGLREHRRNVNMMTPRSYELIHGNPHGPYPTPDVFPALTPFNAAPQAGTFEDGSSHTTEELKYKRETRKIFEVEKESDLPIDVTCVRVDTFNGHALSVHAEFLDPLTVEEASEILSCTTGVELHDDDEVPQPIYVAGTDPVHVGRLRQSERFHECGLDMWVVGDNLRAGAALNLAKGAELLIKR